jgi:FMN reductase
MKLGIVVGNPNPKSRTLTLADAVGDEVGAIVGETSRFVVDLVDLAAGLFDPNNEEVTAVVNDASTSDILVVASPTYKAAYTGLLKAFLDRFDTRGLEGVVVIPVMTGGSPAHSLAPETALRPVLVELGASMPTRSLYFETSQMPDLPGIVKGWASENHAALRGAAYSRRQNSDN